MKLPARLENKSLLHKLMYIAVIATAGGTALAMLVLFAQQWFLQRNELAKVVYAQAAIIAANSTSPLLFNDREAAEQMLAAFAKIDNIEFAGLLDKDGQAFASYVHAEKMISPHLHIVGEDGQNILGWDYIEVALPIVSQSERIGLIHVRSDLSPVYDRLKLSMIVTLSSAFFALLGAAFMLLRLLPGIADPLAALAEMMEAVSRDKNYARRAHVRGRDELALLAQGFNSMLEQIQQRDEAAARHRDQLEEEVAKRTASLTEAQRIAHLGNWEWDIANNKLEWSDETYRIFGLAPQQFDATYHAFLQTIHPDDRAELESCVRVSMHSGLPYSIDHRIVLPEGETRYVHEQAEVLLDAGGRAVKMHGTVHDITERKLADEKIRKLNEELESKVHERTRQLLEAQDELVRKEKLAVLGQVAGSVGHELRNPLGVMSNAVYFLQTVLQDADATTKEYLSIINSEIAASDRIVSDLLDSVRTKLPQAETVGVAELVEQTLGKCELAENIRLAADIPPDLPPLHVDGLQIHQVLRNLISNGAEAMAEKGGTLQISARANPADKTITIGVSDQGCGMTAEQMDRLFQPLNTTKARGIGLGLVVVKNLTEANGGKVEVKSEAGKGALFSVTLPAA